MTMTPMERVERPHEFFFFEILGFFSVRFFRFFFRNRFFFFRFFFLPLPLASVSFSLQIGHQNERQRKRKNKKTTHLPSKLLPPVLGLELDVEHLGEVLT